MVKDSPQKTDSKVRQVSFKTGLAILLINYFHGAPLDSA